MLKKCKVVMLPINEKAEIWWSGQKLYFNNTPEEPRGNCQHLYILSDEEIKEGDWGYSWNWYNKINHFPNGCNRLRGYVAKIIATTDKSLTIFKPHMNCNGVGCSECLNTLLPQPSQSFIEKYIEKYNKDEQISEVIVEYYDYVKEDEDWDDNIGAIPHDIHICKPKINPKDNTITIKPVKNSWNREEVRDLILNAYQRGYEDRDFDIDYGSNKPFCLEQMDK